MGDGRNKKWSKDEWNTVVGRIFIIEMKRISESQKEDNMHAPHIRKYPQDIELPPPPPDAADASSSDSVHLPIIIVITKQTYETRWDRASD